MTGKASAFPKSLVTLRLSEMFKGPLPTQFHPYVHTDILVEHAAGQTRYCSCSAIWILSWGGSQPIWTFLMAYMVFPTLQHRARTCIAAQIKTNVYAKFMLSSQHLWGYHKGWNTVLKSQVGYTLGLILLQVFAVLPIIVVINGSFLVLLVFGDQVVHVAFSL